MTDLRKKSGDRNSIRVKERKKAEIEREAEECSTKTY